MFNFKPEAAIEIDLDEEPKKKSLTSKVITKVEC